MFHHILLIVVTMYALAGAVMAADLPSRRAPPPVAYAPPPVFSWTGGYLGLSLGYGWQNARSVNYALNTLPIVQTVRPSGVVGGAYAGYNYQFNNFVVGVEADIEGSGVYGTDIFGASVGQNVRGSARGRLGYAFDRALFFATGGVTVGNVTYSNPGYFLLPFGGTYSATRAGWNVGGGMEFAFNRNWTARVEYRYSDLGRSHFVSSSAIGQAYDVRVNDNTVRAGVGYKFDTFFGGPAVNGY